MNKIKKRVLVINLGWEQQPLIDRLSEMDIELYGIHYNNEAYKPEIFRDILITDLRDLPAIIEFSDRISPDAVISDQCDYSYFAQSVIAEKNNLPGTDTKIALISTNKYLQREKAAQAGVLQPDYALCNGIEDLNQFANQHGFPIIIKPLDNRGSFGVVKIETQSEIKPAYFEALVNSHSRQLIAEKFIKGLHITIDGYVFKEKSTVSLALATKKLLSEEMQVAMDIYYPGELPAAIREKAMRLNEEVNNSLGYTFGMTHSEYMIDENDDIYLIESANRGGGCFTSEIIVPAVCDIDILSQYIYDCLGRDESLYTAPSENKVILKFFALEEQGVISEIEGIDTITDSPEVLKFRLNNKIGDRIVNITNDGNRHGFVILRSDGDIREKANRILSYLSIKYEG
jgi:biotin carboxylase